MDAILNALMRASMNFQFPVAIKNRGSFEVIGTCIAMTDGARYFLVTASHVINVCLNPPGLGYYLCNWVGGDIISIEEDIVGCDVTDGEYSNYDVAVIKIDRNRYQSVAEENFLGLNGLFIDGGESFKRIYALSGFPISKNRSFPKYKTSPFFFFYLTEPSSKDLTPLEKIFALLVPYDHENVRKPSGMSGGGLWIIASELPCLPSLAGILVSWAPESKMIEAIKMDCVVSLIKGFFPGGPFDDVQTSMHVIEGDGRSAVLVPIR